MKNSELFNQINQILKLKNLFAENFKNVFINGMNSMLNVFPKNNCSENIFLAMILFLSNPNRNVVKTEKLNLIKYLINTTKEDFGNGNIKSGKLIF